MRWRLKLAEYEYKIEYKFGKANVNADFLNRPINQINQSNFNDFQMFHQQTLTINVPPKDKTPKNKIKNLVIPLALDA